MSRPNTIFHKPIFLSLALASLAAAWGGCATGGTGTSSSSSSSSGSGGGTSSSGGTGGFNVDGGGGGSDDGGLCTSKTKEAHRVPLDIIFLLDRSGSMTGARWAGVTSGLGAFFSDPVSSGIGAGLVFFPTQEPYDCDPTHYAALSVPIAPLPGNAFALMNSIPANPTGVGTPTYGALKGALMAATAYQDAHPTHKVIVVTITDGEPIGCEPKTIIDIANLAESARNYNGVLTFVIGVEGSIISNLNKIASAGGTGSAYDITQDIGLFSQKTVEIRQAALGCDFELPEPPPGEVLDPEKVNFTYTPMGSGNPKVIPRADDLADCGDQPGWYFDSNTSPTRIILCPASCSTVQADANAKVEVAFGCKSIIN